MGRDEKRLIKALQQQQHVTRLQVSMASIILAHNGIDSALEYVSGLTSATPDRARRCPVCGEIMDLVVLCPICNLV